MEFENELVEYVDKKMSVSSKPLPIIKHNGFHEDVDRADKMKFITLLNVKPCTGIKKCVHTFYK